MRNEFTKRVYDVCYKRKLIMFDDELVDVARFGLRIVLKIPILVKRFYKIQFSVNNFSQ